MNTQEMVKNLNGIGEITKIQKYKWKVKDEPGTLEFIPKNILNVDPAYQRALMDKRAIKLAAEWSWVACGALIIAKRGRKYWVVDGQHRVAAAMKRADIDRLPCVVFDMGDTENEAQGFLDANTNRRPMFSIERFKALVMAGNDAALYVDTLFDDLGISFGKGPKQLRSVAWALRIAEQDRETFEVVIRLVAQLCAHQVIPERLLSGLWHLHHNGLDLHSKKLRDRITHVGVTRIIDGMARAVAFRGNSGTKVLAEGILNEINKGLSMKFEMPE